MENLSKQSIQAIFDISDRENLIEEKYIGTIGRSISHTQSFLSVLDVSDPTRPIISKIVDVSRSPHALAIKDNYLFIASDNTGLFIMYISDKESPIEIAVYNTPGIAKDVYIDGNYAYVADDVNGLVIINIADPINPTHSETCAIVDQVMV